MSESEMSELESPPKPKGAWVRKLALAVLILSAVLSAPILLLPLWDWADAFDDAHIFGYYGGVNVVILLVMLMIGALVPDLTAIVLAVAFSERGRKLANVIMSAGAVVLIAGTIAWHIIPWGMD